MLNLSFRNDRLVAGAPRAAGNGFLSCTGKHRSFGLTRWPELASFESYTYDGAEWRPDAKAANRVFAAYLVPPLRYRLRAGQLCEAETGQGVMAELLGDNTDDVEHQAFCRVDAQWGAFEAAIPHEASQVASRFRRTPVAILRLLAVVPEAAVLAEANPAVFFELACHFDAPASRPELRDDMLRLLRGPQRDILALRGLAASESARRLFRKLPPEDVCTPRLRTLGRARQSRGGCGISPRSTGTSPTCWRMKRSGPTCRGNCWPIFIASPSSAKTKRCPTYRDAG